MQDNIFASHTFLVDTWMSSLQTLNVFFFIPEMDYKHTCDAIYTSRA